MLQPKTLNLYWMLINFCEALVVVEAQMLDHIVLALAKVG